MTERADIKQFIGSYFTRMEFETLNKQKRLVREFPGSSLSMIFQCRYVYQHQLLLQQPHHINIDF